MKKYTRARPQFTSRQGSRGVSISLPHNYSKNTLPNTTLTEVNIGDNDNDASFSLNISLSIPGIDIKDIPNVNDFDFSVTLNGFFLVRWQDPRLIMDNVKFGGDALIPVDVSLVREGFKKRKDQTWAFG